ncbi:MAG: SAM-dependent methyltransferase [Ruminococcus flavefaciens]|nr:SAM-dependent methyltransferase [Ruminococcus flavefaciens]
MKKVSASNLTAELRPIGKELDAVIAMGHSPYQVFEDWISLMFYAFQRNDTEYLKIVASYKQDKDECPEITHFSNACGLLMKHMGETNKETLGDLYMEYAANHYHGQFFTPFHAAEMMAKLAQTDVPEDENFTILDPSCGAGIMLIAAAKAQSFSENGRALFVGQDIDLNCVKMTALNLMFFNLNGLVIWGNTLAVEVRQAWATHRNILLGGSLYEYDAEKAAQFIGGKVAQK